MFLFSICNISLIESKFLLLFFNSYLHLYNIYLYRLNNLFYSIIIIL